MLAARSPVRELAEHAVISLAGMLGCAAAGDSSCYADAIALLHAIRDAQDALGGDGHRLQ